MTTALALITDSYQSIGVYAPGETLTDADAELGLTVMNNMLDSWSNESLTTYAIQEQHFTLVPGQSAYTIGSGGNINGTRPLRILDSYGTAYILDNNSNRYPIGIMNQAEWNLIGNIANTNSDIPTRLFYDPQFPLGIINLFPTPIIGWTCYFDSWIQLTDFSNLTSTLSLPPGYERAIKRNLALEVWPYFKSERANPPAALIRAAAQSLGNIKRTNIKKVVAVYDSEIISKATPTYNIYRDSPNYS